MDNWLKQTKESPLFSELEWEKPERKDQAGTLMIVGGNLHGFASVAKADQIAHEQGIGHTRIMLPDALRKTLAPLWTNAIFCPSTATGSFSKDSVDLVLQNALSAHGVLLTGDLGRNSETAILLDTILHSYNGPVAITKDALDYYLERPKDIFLRDSTLIVGSFSQLQKLFGAFGYPDPLVYTMPLASLVGTIQRFTQTYHCTIMTRSDTHVVVGHGGRVSTTKLNDAEEIWRLSASTRAIVSWLHHPSKPFEAVTYSLLT
jgi:ADP-dependent NAD(P)H-hydrate dehydratase / NAD(P)H-hydrate epimerase